MKHEPLIAKASESFGPLLAGLTLLVSAYQAGRLIALSCEEGELVSRSCHMHKPMGIAACEGKLAVVGAREVWEYRQRAEGLIPESARLTGDLGGREVEYVGGAPCVVSSRFSSLVMVAEPEFLWRPKFLRHHGEDQCHLNGLALREGSPKWATALGDCSRPEGWRANKRSGGVLIDIESDEIAVRGLSMPHSPRIHAGDVWLLESGTGRVGIVRGEAFEPVAELDGFTRGLSIVGDRAFVGLSQIRETAHFGDLPITERLANRKCGVAVIDLKTGAVQAELEFAEGIEEVAAVACLAECRIAASQLHLEIDARTDDYTSPFRGSV